MPNTTTTVVQLSGFPPALPNVPPNYPLTPSPDKISLLFEANKLVLWRKFSPYTDGDNIFGIFPNKQPFVYRYPDEAQNSLFNRLPEAIKTLASAGPITQGTVDDVVRVSKFSLSPSGILYNIKQFGLQRLQPFDETRTYNPLSPILATISGMTFGIGDRPLRHIEGNFLSGLLNSVTSTVGINFQNGYQTPSSTVGPGALPKINSGQGKGLIRGADASKASAKVKSIWSTSTPQPNLGLSGLFSQIKDAATSLFGNPKQPAGITYRADEKTYDLMVTSKGKLFTYTKQGVEIPVTQSWISNNIVYGEIREIQQEGAALNSDIIKSYNDYTSNPKDYISTFRDATSYKAKKLNDELQRLVDNINLVGSYNVAKSPASYLLPAGSAAGNTQYIAYDNWTSKAQGANKIGTVSEYQNNTNEKPKSVDASVSPNNNLRIGTTFKSDALNRVGVIGANKKIAPIDQYPNYTEYKPYEDDLIAFFFYDVVNNKYIPFRATVKTLSEGNTAFWDELRFIGRSDQLYSYNGFSRTLSFTFNVVISSLSEMLPTWQKINYMASSVKPSNYTRGTSDSDVFNRFIVPPMFMLTVGDLYKFQPIVITSININIPDDATWETLNEFNSKQWSYLNGIIGAPKVGKNYAQLPKEVEISVTCNLLEKERAVIGGSHFGHAPRRDDWENRATYDRVLTENDTTLQAPSDFHEGLVVWNSSEESSYD